MSRLSPVEKVQRSLACDQCGAPADAICRTAKGHPASSSHNDRYLKAVAAGLLPLATPPPFDMRGAEDRQAAIERIQRDYQCTDCGARPRARCREINDRPRRAAHPSRYVQAVAAGRLPLKDTR